MFRALMAASVFALGGCAGVMGETPAMCRAVVDVARVYTASESGRVAFEERDGVVSCSAEGADEQICAAYRAEPPGAGLAPIGEALRSCLYGHGYIRTAERREGMIVAMRGGFRFGTTLHLRLDGARYLLELDERVILTEARGARAG
jgi:hypothetical protein